MLRLGRRLAVSLCCAFAAVCLLGAQAPGVTYVYDELGRLVAAIAPQLGDRR